MQKYFWAWVGCVLAFLSVLLGAFGAHFLKARLNAEMFAIFETGVNYHQYHALAMVAVGSLEAREIAQTKLFRVGLGLLLVGIVLFSGSLYVLAFTGVKELGVVTPVGGAAFLASWVCLALVFLLHGRAEARQSVT